MGHLNIARRFLVEGKRYIELKDPIQASEKLYKSAEEAVKALAEKYGIEAYADAEQKGRWTVSLLEKAVRELSEKFGDDIRRWWDTAYRLHVNGFHETKLTIDDVNIRVSDIDRLVKFSGGEKGEI